MPVNVIPFFSSLASPCLVETHTKHLRESGARIISPIEFKDAKNQGADWTKDLTVFFIGTGGTENQVADFVTEAGMDSPFLVLSHPANNSLPASMEIRTFLNSLNHKALVIHHPLNGLVTKLKRWDLFMKVLDTLKNTKLGLIGNPSFWLIASNIDRDEVRRRWGLTFQDYELECLKDPETDHNSEALKTAFIDSAKGVDIPLEEIEKASPVATKLERLMKEESLAAVTVQCFDFLMDTHISGCLALSHINNQSDMTAGCEGDVPATFTMLLSRLLTGSSGFMSNVSSVMLDSNSAVFSHCTVATSLVSEYEVTTHFESEMSVGIRGIFELDDVTILKVGGKELSDYWVSSGKIVENLRNDDNCRTQIRVHLDNDAKYFLESSLANHHVVIPGNHVDLIEDFFSFILLRE